MDVSCNPESERAVTDNTKKDDDDSNRIQPKKNDNAIQLNENNYSSNKTDPNNMTCAEIKARLNLFGIKTKQKDKKNDLVAKYLEMTETTDKKKRKSDNVLETVPKITKLDTGTNNILDENSERVHIDNITEKDIVIPMEEPSPEQSDTTKKKPAKDNITEKDIVIPMEEPSLEQSDTTKKKPAKAKSKPRGGTQTNGEVNNVCKTTDNINQMKVSELKSSLKSFGLSTSGLKPILTQRLTDVLAENAKKTKKLTDTLDDKTADRDMHAINKDLIPNTQNEVIKANTIIQIEVEDIPKNANSGQIANKDKLSEVSEATTETADNGFEAVDQSDEDNGETKEDKSNNVISKKLTNQKERSSRQAKYLSSDQYDDMTDSLPLGSYDFGEQSVLVMNTTNLQNGVNFHIPKSILMDPAIPKDDLKRVLLESGLKRNEVAITCGLSAQKAFTPKNDGKDGTGTQFLKEISPDFVNSDGLPNIIKSEGPVRDAFTFALPHATFVTAHEVCKTMFRQTKSKDLREVLQDIFNKNSDIQEGNNRAVMMGIKSAMDQDIENKNEEEYNSSDFSDEEVNEDSENQMELRQKLLEIVKLKPIAKEDLFHEADPNGSVEQEDLEQAVNTILTLKQATFNNTSKKLEYVEDL